MAAKKAAKKTAKKAVKKTTNRSVAKKTAKKTTLRKAPTRGRVIAREDAFPYKQVVLVLGSIVVVGGVSLYLGFSDAGQIDIARTLQQNAEQKAAAGEVAGTVEERRAVDAAAKRPRSVDGGLTPSKNQKPAPKPTATDTASSTEATASSTDAAAADAENASSAEAAAEEVLDTEVVDGGENEATPEEVTEEVEAVSNETETAVQ